MWESIHCVSMESWLIYICKTREKFVIWLASPLVSLKKRAGHCYCDHESWLGKKMVG